MVTLFTRRLKIIPLTKNDIKVGIHNKARMDLLLGLNPTEDYFSDSIKNILQSKIKKMEADPSNWLYYTFWQMVLSQENCAVGELCFTGPPTLNGEIEIGYYTDAAFQDRGYMTEALKAMITWAFSKPAVSCIKARTTRTNFASHRVLLKAGMTIYLKESLYWWIIRK
jgi:[ribosomal protein S5]-alanine N-acetyltransferase